MTKWKKTGLLSLIFLIPFLLSLDSSAYNSNYYAKYISPEGISLLSYTDTWDEEKLKQLYDELIKNKHGEEIYHLQEIRVYGGHLQSAPLTRGQYHTLTSTITLYYGDVYTEPSTLKSTLSHEYGHHFTYHYLKEQHLPFSKWAKIRGLQTDSVRWDAFWNYTSGNHKWYPQEISADDYKLLYGATHQIDIDDVYSNEAFYVMTLHENQELSNVFDNTVLHRYLEDLTGIPIETSRIIQTPQLSIANGEMISFKVTEKANVAYRLTITYQDRDTELISITENGQSELVYSIKELFEHGNSSLYTGYLEATIDVVDLSTSLGFKTKPFKFKLTELD